MLWENVSLVAVATKEVYIKVMVGVRVTEEE